MASGIICEYNPFHKGHAYQMQATGDPDIVCIMSGNYTQRGEPAICDKWLRTRMALEAGAALVIELPTYYSTAVTQFFAQGGVRLAAATGIIDRLSFGVEPGAETVLESAAATLCEKKEEFDTLLQSHLSDSISFAAAREKALRTFVPDAAAHLTSPNAILGLEYLLQMRQQNTSLESLMIPRRSAGYHDTDVLAEMPSAAALRGALSRGEDISSYLPAEVCSVWQDTVFVNPAAMGPALQYALNHHTPETLSHIVEVSEGLENRILRESGSYPSYEELLRALATKRYPTARLRRILLNIYLNITKEDREAVCFTDGPAYIRVLGFRKDREKLLSSLCEKASLPVVTSPVRPPLLSPAAKKMLQDEARFTDLYMALLPASERRKRGQEYRMPIVIK